jgi:hypothetical protein
MAKMSDTELSALLQAERESAIGALNSSKLTEERNRAMRFYQGDMDQDLPAPPNRSKAISSDVLDTVEGMMPQMMEALSSGEDMVTFDATSQEDEEAAAQETDYVNHVFTKKNPGWLILYSFVKDSLLSKNGIVKVTWEEEELTRTQTFYDQGDDVFALISQDYSDQIVEHEAKPDPMDPTGQAQLHDITVESHEEYGCAKVYNVPGEEFLISKNARDIKTATYCAHILDKTQEELIAQGFDPKQVKNLPNKTESYSSEEQTRNTVEEWQSSGSSTENNAGRKVDVTEHYIRCDYDGSGKPQLLRVTTGGVDGSQEILKRDGKPDIVPIEMMPFAAMTPYIMTHRFWGRSAADMVMDIQKIKTVLVRQLLDNAYLANNGRMEVSEAHTTARTVDDLLNNRPGGIVRTRQPGGLIPIPHVPIGDIFPLIEYVDQTREFRTGVSKTAMGLNAGALQDQTAQAASQMLALAQAKIKLIARIFAETGIKDLFLLLHHVIRKHGSKRETVKLRSKWVTVDPREWKDRDDMSVSLTASSGSKTERLTHLTLLLQMQKEALSTGTGLCDMSNVYNTIKQITQVLDFKSPEPYFKEPAPNTPPPEPPKDPAIQVEEMKTQAKMAELQQKAQFETQKMQMDAQLQAVTAQRQAEVEQQQAAADIQVKQMEAQFKAQLEAQKLAADKELAAQKFEFEKQIKMLELGMKREELAMKKEEMGAGLEFKRQELGANLEFKRNEHQQKLEHAETTHSQALELNEAAATGEKPRKVRSKKDDASDLKMLEHLSKLTENLSKPRKIKRANGRIEGIE